MDREFDGAIPNARVAVKDVTYAQAIDYKEEIEAIEGVESVTQMIPRTSDKTEQALVDELKKDEDIISITSLTDIPGPAIPVELVLDSLKVWR